MQHVQAVVYYSALKKDEILKHAIPWINKAFKKKNTE